MANRIYSVTEVNSYVSRSLQMDPMIQQISIRGEVSNARRYASGHWYFTLKDESSALRCVWFLSSQKESSVRLEEGARIVVQGSLGLYLRDGQYQMTVTRVQADGVGSWYERFEQLKAHCLSQGWFDEDRKKPLPEYPKTIGIVTSPDGAALRDIIRVAHRRMPWVNLLLYPVLVQGDMASGQIAQAITELGERGECDVIIAGRGGGSIEDLWAFNEMPVVKAIALCPIPVISAVGHQTDFTLSDFAADVRAATPSMAAELATCDGDEMKRELTLMAERLDRGMIQLIDGQRSRLQQLEQRLDHMSPSAALNAGEEKLKALKERLERVMERLIIEKRAELIHAQKLLDAMNPAAITERGYALVRKADGSLVTDSSEIPVGELLQITLARGRVKAKVEEIISEEPYDGI